MENSPDHFSHCLSLPLPCHSFSHPLLHHAVDHLVLEVDPREDRSWLQTSPAVISDGCHTFDATGE